MRFDYTASACIELRVHITMQKYDTDAISLHICNKQSVLVQKQSDSDLDLCDRIQ